MTLEKPWHLPRSSAPMDDLFDAGRADGPSLDSIRRTASVLGLAGTSLAGAALVVSSASRGGVAAGTFSAVKALLHGHWLVSLVGAMTIGASVGVTAIVAVNPQFFSHAPNIHTGKPRTQYAGPVQQGYSGGNSRPVVEASQSVPPMPVPPMTRDANSTPPAPTPAIFETIPVLAPRSPSQSSALAEQVLLLDRAREALAQGDRTRALEVLDRYLAVFPEGALIPEARSLRHRAVSSIDDQNQ
jgi:hypothetical protein